MGCCSWHYLATIIGQFLVCPAKTQPIRREQVGAFTRQLCCLHIIYPTWLASSATLCKKNAYGKYASHRVLSERQIISEKDIFISELSVKQNVEQQSENVKSIQISTKDNCINNWSCGKLLLWRNQDALYLNSNYCRPFVVENLN